MSDGCIHSVLLISFCLRCSSSNLLKPFGCNFLNLNNFVKPIVALFCCNDSAHGRMSKFRWTLVLNERKSGFLSVVFFFCYLIVHDPTWLVSIREDSWYIFHYLSLKCQGLSEKLAKRSCRSCSTEGRGFDCVFLHESFQLCNVSYSKCCVACVNAGFPWRLVEILCE